MDGSLDDWLFVITCCDLYLMISQEMCALIPLEGHIWGVLLDGDKITI